jgi:hypothetical protein
MKKATQIIFFLLIFNTFSLKAQNSLNVQITGDCFEVSAVYDYIGILNGKNQYSKDLIIQSFPVTMNIRFDGIKWILWANSSPTESGFINTNVTSSLIAPLIGWQNNTCTNGTLTISEILATNQFENNKIAIYPNPTSDYITIQNTENQTESLNFKIIDLTGRVLKSDSINNNEKINVEELISGNYIVQIQNESNKIISRKLSIN